MLCWMSRRVAIVLVFTALILVTAGRPTPIAGEPLAGNPIGDAQALWLDTNTIAWAGTVGASYKLLYDADGALDTVAAASTACSFPAPAASCYVSLTASGTISGYWKNPNATGKPRLLTGLSGRECQISAQGSGGRRQLRRWRQPGGREPRADSERAGCALCGQREDADPGRELQRRGSAPQGVGAHGQDA